MINASVTSAPRSPACRSRNNPPLLPRLPALKAAAANQSIIAAQNAQITEAAAALEGVIALMDMENRVRNRRNEDNARILGYVDAMADMQRLGGFVGDDRFHELRTEIEESRYYPGKRSSHQKTHVTKLCYPVGEWVLTVHEPTHLAGARIDACDGP
ncbi:MAG: hypothetical protein J6386_13040 [Candidatus Synoicihabitans palmerolidicus]|nr:hypothetical protein [Candidatus Synoicihabitans palmerolidicus]